MLPDTYWRDLLTHARAHLEDVQHLITICERLAGSAPPSQTSGRKAAAAPAAKRGRPPATALNSITVRAAVRRVLEEHGPMRARDVLARMQAAGWTPRRSSTDPANVVATTLSQLVKAGTLRLADGSRNGTSVYALPTPSTATLRKLAAAERRHAVTRPAKRKARGPAARPAKAKRAPRRLIRNEVPLHALVRDALSVKPRQTARDLADYLHTAKGWRTSSANPVNLIRIALKQQPLRDLVRVDRSGEHHRFFLRSPSKASKASTTRPEAATPAPAAAPSPQEQ